MPLAYVLIKVDSPTPPDMSEKLEKVSGVKEVHALFGEFDFILKLVTPTMDEINKTVVKEIRKIPGVKETKTYITINF